MWVVTMAVARAVGVLVAMPAITAQHQVICPTLVTERRSLIPAPIQAVLARMVVQEVRAPLAATAMAILLLETAIIAAASVVEIIVAVAPLEVTAVAVGTVEVLAADMVEVQEVAAVTVVVEALAAVAVASHLVATAAAENTNPAQTTTA